MKIRYLSTSRLPTSKAYGVTVFETAEAALRMGLDFLVYSPTPGHKELREYQRSVACLRFPKALENRNNKRFKQAVFNFNSLVIPLLASLKSDFRKADVYWLRDPIAAFFICLTRRDKKTLLELHHMPGEWGLILLRFLMRFKNFSVCVISDDLASQIQIETHLSEVLICPMAVSSKFFCDRQRKFSNNPIRFIYSGKGQSSGFDNGLEALIFNLRSVWETSPAIQVTFLGLEDIYVDSLRNLIDELGLPDQSFTFISHVSHDEVPGILEKHDIGLLPYPENKYHAERFPIKSLEYAASGLAILASRTRAHVQIIGEDNAWFYDPTDPESISLQVELMLDNPGTREKKLKQAQEWARRYTYEGRITVVQDFFLD